MKIYGFNFLTFNLTKVLLTAEEMAIDYELVTLNAMQGEHKTEQHLARHPFGQIPVLEDKDFRLFESMAICRYLIESASSSTGLLSDNLRQRALQNQWVDMFLNATGKHLATFFYQEIVMPRRQLPVDQKACDEANNMLKQQLPLVENRLQSKPYLFGAELSLPDIVAWSYFEAASHTSYTLDQFPAISAWYTKLENRPSVQRIYSHYRT